MLLQRKERALSLAGPDELPDFLPETQHIRDGDWHVPPVPLRLRNRHIDLGDVSPTNTKHFAEALKSTAQGVQVGFWCVL